MFKLAILAAVLAVAAAFPGGLTGVVLDHGLGPIHAPQVISHAVSHAHVIAQPAPVVHQVHQAPLVHHVPVVHQAPVVHQVHQAPVVHQVPIVTKTVINSHGHGHAGLSLGGHGWL
ncbi:uncharacterized protein LOC117174088 [Belonocnema kinseyi]|uniref:uncharacterized protein LOC117174088 n=1 Tax=Belonocnema kinseyi TaxID=2817044 RepID=UPI00143D619D|nr:uncharacterized protein LOC117174088 [Belonocnema kinseyi]